LEGDAKEGMVGKGKPRKNLREKGFSRNMWGACTEAKTALTTTSKNRGSPSRTLETLRIPGDW